MDKINRFKIRIRELREEMGFTSQQSFADSFGTRQSTVGGWESGAREPKIDTLIRLAAFFGTTVDDLLCGDGPRSFDDSWEWDGSYLKELRENQGLSQAEISEKLNISLQLYRRIEQAEICPSVPLLCRMAISLHTSIDLLINLSNPFEGFDALSSDEKRLLDIFHRVNQDGKDQILKQAGYAIRDEHLLPPREQPAASAESVG